MKLKIKRNGEKIAAKVYLEKTNKFDGPYKGINLMMEIADEPWYVACITDNGRLMLYSDISNRFIRTDDNGCIKVKRQS